MRRAVAVLIVVALSGGRCTVVDAGGDPVIDAWPVGAPLDCPDARRCDELIWVGLAGLDRRDGAHASVVAVHLHDEGAFIDPATGRQIITKRSGGCCRVLVVELSDGTTRAIGVGYPGISKEAVAVPWGP